MPAGRRPNAAATPAALDDGSIADLEQKVGGRIGVVALEAETGIRLEHRAAERFAMCSTFKWALVAAVLARVDRGELTLASPLHYGQADLLEYAPVTRTHVAEGRMSIHDLARAAVTVSDNTAANLLLAQVGGPAGLTRFFRELGDDVTRLDRDEPTLNTNEPGDLRDTTSPRAMASSLQRVVGGPVLSSQSRERLVRWLVETETGLDRVRAGLPAGWRAGDKTGTGNRGACNDVVVAWPPDGGSWFVASYFSGSQASLAQLSATHAEIGRLVASRAAS